MQHLKYASRKQLQTPIYVSLNVDNWGSADSNRYESNPASQVGPIHKGQKRNYVNAIQLSAYRVFALCYVYFLAKSQGCIKLNNKSYSRPIQLYVCMYMHAG